MQLSKKLLKTPKVLKQIEERSDDLVRSMLDLALGHYVTVSKFNKLTGEVETRIYEQPPDYKALSFLLENVIGKVPNRLEITGEGGGPVKVVPYMTMEEAIRYDLVKDAIKEQKQLEAGSPDDDDDSDSDDYLDAVFESVEAEGGDALGT